MIKIMHVTPGLQSGGAETMLQKLVTEMDRSRFHSHVVSLTDRGSVLGDRIEAANVSVEALGFRAGVPDPRLITALARAIRRFRPDIIQTWMYHGDFMGTLATKFVPKTPLIWGVHATNLEPMLIKRGTRAIIQLNAKLSHHGPTRIVCCSQAAYNDHLEQGYPSNLMTVVPNGIDIAEFVPRPEARREIRDELALPIETPLIGLVARFDPQKDHRNFFQAAGLLHRRFPEAHFVLCGSGITQDNAALWQWVTEAGVSEVTHLLGLRRDSARVSAALDIATCCSCYGESFALVLGEAMASGVPAVTTAMPGPAEVVGDCGWVVPVKDPQALADAWQTILALSSDARAELAIKSRQRIVDHFSLTGMVWGYESVYTNVLGLGTLSQPRSISLKN